MCNYFNMSYALITCHWVNWCTRKTRHAYLITSPSDCPTPRRICTSGHDLGPGWKLKPSKSILPATWSHCVCLSFTQWDPSYTQYFTPAFLAKCLPPACWPHQSSFPLMSSTITASMFLAFFYLSKPWIWTLATLLFAPWLSPFHRAVLKTEGFHKIVRLSQSFWKLALRMVCERDFSGNSIVRDTH